MTAFLLNAALFTAVLLLCCLGGRFSERAGVFPLGLEGLMVFGALGGLACANALPEGMSRWAGIPLCLLSAGMAGLAGALPLAAAVPLKGDPVWTGTAVNLLSVPLALLAARMTGEGSADVMDTVRAIEWLGEKQGQLPLLLPIVLAFAALGQAILAGTRFGIRLRACGENAGQSLFAGLQVGRTRVLGVLLCGFFGGMGGLGAVLAQGGSWNVGRGAMGLGFLALAALTAGRRKKTAALAAAVVLGTACALWGRSGEGILGGAGLPEGTLEALPYLLALVALALCRRGTGIMRNAESEEWNDGGSCEM